MSARSERYAALKAAAKEAIDAKGEAAYRMLAGAGRAKLAEAPGSAMRERRRRINLALKAVEDAWSEVAA